MSFMILLSAAVGLIAGFIASVSGGSGMIILPILLMSGLPPHIALGTNKVYTSTSLFVATINFVKQKVFQIKYWIAAAIACVFGSITGVILVDLVQPGVLKKLLPIFIIIMAIYVLSYKKPSSQQLNTSRQKNIEKPWLKTMLGGLLGMYSGFFGSGTGIFWVTLTTGLFKVDILEASGISRFMCFLSNVTALMVFIVMKQVDFKVGAIIAITGAIGAHIGSKTAIKFGANFIKPLLVTFTILIASYLIYKNYL